MRERLHHLRRWIGLDRAVFFTAGARFWNLGSGLLTLALVGTKLTEETQGFYYTFNSVMAMQIFLELGLSQSLLQFASHEFARLSFGEGGSLQGDAQAAGRLRTLGKLALRWYGLLALLLVVLIGVGGHFFLAAKNSAGIAWAWPWWLFCGVAALNLWLTPVWFLLEGCNQVASVSRYRLVVGIAASLASWTVLWLGGGLFACVAYSGTLLAGSMLYLWRCWPGFFRDVWQSAATSARGWLREIWPFQWRIAVSWGCGYFTFSILTPLMFQLHGSVLAGRMGMTWQAINGVILLATAWTQTKAPLYGILINQRKYVELDRIFRKATVQATLIALAAAVVLVGVVAVLQMTHPLGRRFLELPAVALFCLSAILIQFTGSMAVYLRAHKQEPFLIVSIVSAVATTAGVAVLGWRWGGVGAAWGHLLASALTGPLLGIYIFLRKRAEWHRAT